MPQLRQYPQIFSLLATDALPIDRIGQGTVFIESENFVPDAGGFLINANNINLTLGTWGLQSSAGTFTGVTLPQISTLLSTNYLDIMDMDNNAGTNHLTVNAFAGDLIASHGVTSSTYVINISNTITRLMVNTNGTWTAIGYGM